MLLADLHDSPTKAGWCLFTRSSQKMTPASGDPNHPSWWVLFWGRKKLNEVPIGKILDFRIVRALETQRASAGCVRECRSGNVRSTSTYAVALYSHTRSAADEAGCVTFLRPYILVMTLFLFLACHTT